MAVWDSIEDRPDDKERQDGYLTGVGDVGGNDQGQLTIRQTVMPSEEA